MDLSGYFPFYFLAWRRAADSLHLFCALSAASLCVGVLIYRTQNHIAIGDERQ